MVVLLLMLCPSATSPFHALQVSRVSQGLPAVFIRDVYRSLGRHKQFGALHVAPGCCKMQRSDSGVGVVVLDVHSRTVLQEESEQERDTTFVVRFLLEIGAAALSTAQCSAVAPSSQNFCSRKRLSWLQLHQLQLADQIWDQIRVSQPWC
eukprot:s2354_g9.t1